MKNILLALFLSILFTTLGCWDEPLLTELGTNRLEVRLKGTYASNTPRNWVKPTAGDYEQNVMDDSIDDLPYAVESELEDFPANLKFDIAEMRLKAANGKVSKFARYRKTFRVGVDDTDSFFNGDGVVMKNDDPVPGREYVSVLIYFRKIIFDQAKYYEISHTGSGSSKVYDYDAGWMTPADYTALSVDNLIHGIFAENEEEGFDFNILQTNYQWDTLRQEEDDTNRVFPLEIPIEGGLVFDNKTDKTVLEIRLVMKNFLKKYEYDVMTYAPAYDDNLAAPVIAHYYAMSDWLRDVKAGETYIGGNLHAIARSYVPGTTGKITGNAPGAGYVIAVPAGADISNYYIDLNGASSLRERYVTTCEPPISPTSPANSLSATMDYLLKYEEYRVGWNAFLSCEDTSGTNDDMKNFIEQWHFYDGRSGDVSIYDGVDGIDFLGVTEGAARGFTIPPYAVYDDGSGFEMENVAQGNYSVYYIPFANSVGNYGRLIEKTDYDAAQQGSDGDLIIDITTNGQEKSITFP